MDLMNWLNTFRTEGSAAFEDKLSKLNDLEDKGVAIDIFDDSYTEILEYYEVHKQLPKGEKSRDFEHIIEEHGFTVDEIMAFYQYTDGSNMINSFKKGVSEEELMSGIVRELVEALDARGMSEDEVMKVIDHCEEARGFETLAKQYEYIKQFVDKPFEASVCKYLQDFNRLDNIEETIANLESCLSHEIGHELIVYRAVDDKWLREAFDFENVEELTGKTLPPSHFMSTSLGYGTSFARYDKFDVVFEIKVPKETQGFYGTSVSVYGNTEDELLLKNPTVVLGKVNPDFVDENGKKKLLIEAEVIPTELEKKMERKGLDNGENGTGGGLEL